MTKKNINIILIILIFASPLPFFVLLDSSWTSSTGSCSWTMDFDCGCESPGVGLRSEDPSSVNGASRRSILSFQSIRSPRLPTSDVVVVSAIRSAPGPENAICGATHDWREA